MEKSRHLASTGIRSQDILVRSTFSVPVTVLNDVTLYGCGPTWWFKLPILSVIGICQNTFTVEELRN